MWRTNFINNLSVLVRLYNHNHLILALGHEHNLRYKKNVNIHDNILCLPNFKKVFDKEKCFLYGYKFMSCIKY